MKKKIVYAVILFFGMFAIFPSEIRGVLVAPIALYALYSVVKKRKFKFTKPLVLNSCLYLMYLISLLFSSVHPEASKRFETGLTLILMPLIFNALYSSGSEIFTKEIRKHFSTTYYIASVLFSIIIILYLLVLGCTWDTEAKNYCISFITHKIPFLYDHPIYTSISLAIAILFSFDLFKNFNHSRKIIFPIIIGNILIGIVLIYLSRKGVLIALIICLIIQLILFLKKRGVANIRNVIYSTALVVISLGTLLVINQRFRELLNPKTYTAINETNSTNNRIQIYSCAFSLIKEKPLLGYGIEYDRDALNNCYKENLYYLFEKEYNTHNQYLSIWLKIGLTGLVIFLMFLIYNIQLAYKSTDVIYGLIIIFYSTIMLTENILERQNGVILFTFLMNYLSFYNLQNTERLGVSQ